MLSPVLFNLYISDIPETSGKKFGYADDLALAVQHKDFKSTENILTEDLSKLHKYFTMWRLIPSLSKTEVSCFHLNNRAADYKLEVRMKNTVLPYQSHPNYLGITLDRTLCFKKHLENTSRKISTRNNLIQKLCSTNWGASADTLRTSALGLVFSAAEYCAPVWMNSPHVNKIDTQLNTTMRIISGCIRTTPLYWLPTLSHIAPTVLRRQEALLKEYSKIMNNQQLPIHEDIPGLTINRLCSRNAPLRLAQQLYDDNFTVDMKWRETWNMTAPTEVQHLIDPVQRPKGFELPRHVWKTLNRIRTGHGVCAYNLHKWGKQPSPSCDCGAPNQTIRHIVEECKLRAYLGDPNDFVIATPSSLDWISGLDLRL